jgi:hypothetical protein
MAVSELKLRLTASLQLRRYKVTVDAYVNGARGESGKMAEGQQTMIALKGRVPEETVTFVRKPTGSRVKATDLIEEFFYETQRKPLAPKVGHYSVIFVTCKGGTGAAVIQRLRDLLQDTTGGTLTLSKTMHVHIRSVPKGHVDADIHFDGHTFQLLGE